MKKYICFGTLIALLLPALALAGPRLTLSQYNQILEESFREGEVARAVYQLYNRGNQPVEILEVKPSCTCTSPAYDSYIEPGGQGRIILEVDTTGRHGRVYQSAIVRTTDPNRNKFLISVEMHVQ